MSKEVPPTSHPALPSGPISRQNGQCPAPLPEILMISTCPPRECGIATYTQDLVAALQTQFSQSFTVRSCPVQTLAEEAAAGPGIPFSLTPEKPESYVKAARSIAARSSICMVVVQHEFGLFEKNEAAFMRFLSRLTKPVVMVFHTVLPRPHAALLHQVREMARLSTSIIVMTQISNGILVTDYQIPPQLITVVAHGTHLVPHADKESLKEKYGLTGRMVLSTFGLLSSGKSIETTLDALPAVIKKHPAVLFLIIGKTHPHVVEQEGEQYRQMLKTRIAALHLEQHVTFINQFLPLPQLLEYLQLTDVYLFTSSNPNQAVSGTFAYAISCGCPVISTPIPHAREVLKDGPGVLIDFDNAPQLAQAVNTLLNDAETRKHISLHALHLMAATAWENTAIAHARLFEQVARGAIRLQYNLPAIHLGHIHEMTTAFGIIQFAHINRPDLNSGYTLDDNARALVAMCGHYLLTGNRDHLEYINIYFRFIQYCMQPDGRFLNYVNTEKAFTVQNDLDSLADANGRAIWSLGYLLHLGHLLPLQLVTDAGLLMQRALQQVHHIHSPRAMAFIIKGLYYRSLGHSESEDLLLIRQFADRLLQMYRHESGGQWYWFENCLTYANSVLSEAMLCAWLVTGNNAYREAALTSFEFLLQKIFTENGIKVISNKTWLHNGHTNQPVANGGEQPIDVAYTILALGLFYENTGNETYRTKMQLAFSWFLGNNHLNQIVYNPRTGGCYDGLEEYSVNLNQGAESSISYLMARLAMENYQHQPSRQARPAALKNIAGIF